MPSKNTVPDLSSAQRFNFAIAPLVRFAGEFTAVVNGMSLSKVLERAVLMYADSVHHQGKTWRDYWERADGSASSAWLLMLVDKSLPLDEDQQRVREFLIAHERFFFERNGKLLYPRQRWIEVFWPHIESGVIVDHWHKSKSVDPYATGEKMCDILKKSGIKPPAWGPGNDD